MLEELQQLLGEDLAKQVNEKLGNVELAIMNDGSVVPADKHERLKAEHKELEGRYQTETQQLNSKLEDALKASENAEEFKKKVEELKENQQKTVDEYESKIQNIKLNTSLDMALKDANAKNIKAVKALLDTESIKYDNDKILGLDAQLEKLKETDGYLFGEVKKVGKAPDKGLETPQGKKAELIARYNEVEQSKNSNKAAILFSLQEEIKKLE